VFYSHVYLLERMTFHKFLTIRIKVPMNSANISLTREFSIRRIDETLFRNFAYFSAGPSESSVTENNSKEDILLGL